MSQRTPMILLAMLLATSAAGVATAATPSESRPGATRIDANGDGVIDRQEAAAHPRLAQRFDELDKNKDGKLSRDELPKRKHRAHRHAGGKDGPRHGHFMSALDTDKDGRISREEAKAQPKFAERFEQLDVNKDGFVDRADFEARASQRRDEWFAAADTDKDGKLSKAEFDAAKRPPMGLRAPKATPAGK